MEPKKLRIVFMGTPAFAAASLRRLVEEGYNVVGVVTMPDKPAGRGLKMQQSAVKEYALEAGLRVMQPEKLKDPAFVGEFRSLRADLGIVIAFRMLPEVIWSLPRLGTFNLHASLLPQYRGAAPINHAIINGETETGVTTFFLNSEIDKGGIIDSRSVAITPSDNAGTLHDKLMDAGSGLVVDTVEKIAAGGFEPEEQPGGDEGLKPAPKIFKEDCRIVWSRRPDEIHNLIRGLSPYPAAWSELQRIGGVDGGGSSSSGGIESRNDSGGGNRSGGVDDGNRSIDGGGRGSGDNSGDSGGNGGGSNGCGSDCGGKTQVVKIFASQPEFGIHDNRPGEIFSDGRTFLNIACGSGYISVTELQLAGKRRMSVEEFLRGFKDPGDYRFV